MFTPASIYDVFMQSQYWLSGQLHEFQASQLEQLLRHARRTVPFYAQRIEHMFRADGSINWDRWTDTPILTRLEVAENFTALLSTDLPANHGRTIEETTSGSTGLPVRIRSSSLNGFAAVAADWRGQRWWNFDWSKTMVHWHSWNESFERHGTHRSYGPWGSPSEAVSLAGEIYAADRDAPLDQRLEHLKRHDASYLGAMGNNPFAVALELIRRQQTLSLQGIMSWSVSVDASFRSAARKAFGSPVHAIYSAKEGCRMAYTSADGSHYHICADMVLFEILGVQSRHLMDWI